MIIRVIFVLICLTAAAFGASEETVKRSLTAGPGGNLVVKVDFGSITVTPNNENKVSVEAYRKVSARSETREQEILRDAPVEITQDGNTVTVRATRRDQNRRGFHIEWGNNNTDARYTISVPKEFNLELHTSGGDVTARDLKGTFKVGTSGGDLKFDNLEGAIQAKTSGGEVAVMAGGGKLDASTSGGDVSVKDFNGDAIVETSGGEMDLQNIHGKLAAETSGGEISAALPSPIAGDVRLETSGGAIALRVPRNAGIDVDADTSAGGVSTDLPFDGTRREDRLRGKINGGGPSVVLRTSAGGIKIKAVDENSTR